MPIVIGSLFAQVHGHGPRVGELFVDQRELPLKLETPQARIKQATEGERAFQASSPLADIDGGVREVSCSRCTSLMKGRLTNTAFS